MANAQEEVMNSVTTKHNSITAPIVTIFKANDDLMARTLNGLTAPEAGRRLTNQSNPILWLAGHVAETRARLLRILGGAIDTTWGQAFDRGAVLEEPEHYPSLDEIKRVMGEINPKFYAMLEGLDDAQLAQPPQLPLPPAKTVADLIGLFAMHDSYHVGQMAYVRKGLGYPGIVG